MSCGKSEPMDSIQNTRFKSWGTGTLQRETTQHDPVIMSSQDDTYITTGKFQTFEVKYQAFKGPVTATLHVKNLHDDTHFKGSPLRKAGGGRMDYFSFDINGASTAHTGRYTVMILDNGLPTKHGANPALTTWSVNVDSSCRIL